MSLQLNIRILLPVPTGYVDFGKGINNPTRSTKFLIKNRPDHLREFSESWKEAGWKPEREVLDLLPK